MSKKKYKRHRRQLEHITRYSEEGYFRGIPREEFGNRRLDNFSKVIFTLTIVILVVLQFGKSPQQQYSANVPPCCEGCDQTGTCFTQYNNSQNNQLIDNSVLFIIVFFLLISCSGCLLSTEPN